MKFRVFDNKLQKDVTDSEEFFMSPDGDIFLFQSHYDSYWTESLSNKFFKKDGVKHVRYTVQWVNNPV